MSNLYSDWMLREGKVTLLLK